MNHKQISQHQISQIKKFAEERGISLEALAEKLTANLASPGETPPQTHKVSTANLEAVREQLCESHKQNQRDNDNRIIDKVTGIEINGRLYKVKAAAEPGKWADCDDCHLKGICNAHDNIPRENERADKLAQALPTLCAFNNEHNEVFLME